MTTLPYTQSNLPKQLFINGKYVESRGSKTKLTLGNPHDQVLVADDVPNAAEQDVDDAVAAAEAAFQEWSAWLPSTRRDVITKFADLLLENKEILASLTRITLGAPKFMGRGEVERCAEAFKYYAGWCDKLGGESYPGHDGFVKIVRIEPLGVVAGITSYNGPLGSFGLKCAPALAAGNCFILKPSEKTPFASLALGALANEAGFPPGVFQVLSGDGLTGALLSSHMRIRKISFTGSILTGKKIQELAARSNLKRVTLELGGKSPAVVFEDANIQNAVTWLARAITMNTGQVCFAASRVYVHDKVYDEFISKYKTEIEEKTRAIGDPEDDETAIGPVIDKGQYERINGFIERGQSQGDLFLGGEKPEDKKGFYIKPAVFTNVPTDAEIHNTEIFGPVAVVRKFSTEEEALKMSNDSELGLMAGVFTSDITRALRVAAKFEAGMVGVNCVSAMFVSTPFGGYKQSGSGREGGKEGLLSWMDYKTVFINSML